MAAANFNLRNPVHLLALGFGSGLLKPAPGTWGTLAAVPFLYLVAAVAATHSVAFVLICCGSFLLGVYVCGRTASDIGVHDHGAIVWDEFVGLFLTFLFVPLSWSNLLAGFVLFRLFDIIKPFPIRWLDKQVHGGLGIMLDDVVAGLLACGLLHLLLFYQVLPLVG